MTARFSKADYAAAFRALLPRGRAWPEDASSTFVRTLAALAGVYEQSDADAVALLADAFPVGTVDLLPEWEYTLGLPDPCAGSAPTLEQRQAAVHARLIAGGGTNRQHYVDFAQALGFTITVADHAPFRAGHGRAGQPLYGPDWSFAWTVHIIADANGLGASVLKCELDAIKPAQTTILIA